MAGRDRKNSLKALFSGDIAPTALPDEQAGRAPEVKSLPGEEAPRPVAAADNVPVVPAVPVARASSGAVKAMGLSLSSITREAEEARALRQALEEGERIIALDTDRIDVSFVQDRLTDGARDDPDFLALVDSIRDSGQQVPILVRPLAGTADRYQVAYGHRRLKAARLLGLPVRAIVKSLTDEELVLAQGKENAERRNLSFIERASFARTLAERQFDRKLISAALGGLMKSEMSRLMQVADAIPPVIVRAIGPAPKAGRDRWMALAELFLTGNGSEQEKALDEIRSTAFLAADSNDRFQMLFRRLMRPKSATKPQAMELKGPDGLVLARIEQQGQVVKIRFIDAVDPAEIADFAGRLAALYAGEPRPGPDTRQP